MLHLGYTAGVGDSGHPISTLEYAKREAPRTVRLWLTVSLAATSGLWVAMIGAGLVGSVNATCHALLCPACGAWIGIVLYLILPILVLVLAYETFHRTRQELRSDGPVLLALVNILVAFGGFMIGFVFPVAGHTFFA